MNETDRSLTLDIMLSHHSQNAIIISSLEMSLNDGTFNKYSMHDFILCMWWWFIVMNEFKLILAHFHLEIMNYHIISLLKL